MDIKAVIVQNIIDISGNIIVDQIHKSDWDARRKNISEYYKDLQPVMETLPDAPTVREIPEQTLEQRGNVDKIVDEICTPDLSPKELLECRECAEEVIKEPSDVMQKYFVSSGI